MDLVEINKIRNQFQAGEWPQFLQMVQIKGLRGWNGQAVEFNYPVIAIVGENGSGKSTLLKAAACVYDNRRDKRFYPSTFFAETHWDRVEKVQIDYRVKRGPNIDSYRISRPSSRWNMPERPPGRDVFLLDVARTLPLDATVGYAKIAKNAAAEIESAEIEGDFLSRLSHVLGRTYQRARFATSDVDQNRPVGVLQREWGELSQFHQGAGEDATLDLFRTLQGIPENALLIIDEVEASLHPRAQRRLIRFLLWLARQRRIQVILSTHSPYVLQELPQEARMMLQTGPQGLSVVHGVSPDFAMSRLDDEVHPEVHVFVEDRDAETLVRESLASTVSSAALLQNIKIVPVGPANVVKLLGSLGANGKLPYESIAILDGDFTDPNCVTLPGGLPPERVVYSELQAAGWPNLVERFGIGAGTLYAALEDAMREPDHHLWNAKVGDQIHKSSHGVWDILAHEWSRICLQPNDLATIVNAINAALLRARA